jgi:thioredoxin-like negative regulator of GroEL
MEDKNDSPAWAEMLADVVRPCDLTVFVAPGCPHCPQAVSAANQVAAITSQVTVTIVDVQASPDLARQKGVKSVPLTVLDDDFFFTGVVSAGQLAGYIVDRGSAGQQALALKTLIEENRLPRAVEQMLSGSGVKPFLALWEKSVTSLRIGLLMAAEEVLEESAAALDAILPGLIAVLGSEDAALRGDTADLLGRIGHSSAIDEIKKLLNDPNQDVAEIAEEVLEEIAESGRR